MSPKHHPNQIELFPTTDDIVQATRESAAEKEWKRERSRRSKRNQVKPAPMPESGPCCGRCHYWVAPARGDTFGACRIRVVTTNRSFAATGAIEKGICLGLDPLTRDLEIGPGNPLIPLFGERVEYEHQHCGPAWSCSGFADAGEAKVAA